MPKRREGPVKNKQTDYYFFDEYVGFPPERKRVRISLRTKDPLKAHWLWEQEYKKQWSAYYGIEKPRQPAPLSFSDLAEEYVKYQRDIKKAKDIIIDVAESADAQPGVPIEPAQCGQGSPQ